MSLKVLVIVPMQKEHKKHKILSLAVTANINRLVLSTRVMGSFKNGRLLCGSKVKFSVMAIDNVSVLESSELPL